LAAISSQLLSENFRNENFPRVFGIVILRVISEDIEVIVVKSDERYLNGFWLGSGLEAKYFDTGRNISTTATGRTHRFATRLHHRLMSPRPEAMPLASAVTASPRSHNHVRLTRYLPAFRTRSWRCQ
jgi:hypothetical protein